MEQEKVVKMYKQYSGQFHIGMRFLRAIGLEEAEEVLLTAHHGFMSLERAVPGSELGDNQKIARINFQSGPTIRPGLHFLRMAGMDEAEEVRISIIEEQNGLRVEPVASP